MWEAFALQQKYGHIWEMNFWKFNETLTNDVVSFEQPGPDVYLASVTTEWASQNDFVPDA